MKNKIMLIVLVAVLLILVVVTVWGIEIGPVQIASISKIIEKNKELNENIQKVSQLTSTEYPDKIKKMEETYEKSVVERTKYEEVAGTVDGIENTAIVTKQYDIGYLWKVIGKYATSRNVTISMNVEKSLSLYNLNFSVTGEYVNISQLISDLENNSDLNFRIHDFKISGSGDKLSASFKVKDVNIDSSTIVATKTTESNTNSKSTNSDSKDTTTSSKNTTTNNSDTTANTSEQNDTNT